MYPAISARILEFFQCKEVNGVNYLVADFTEQCGSTEWNRYLPLAVLALLLYPIGIPLLFFVALYRVRKRHAEPAVQLSLGILFEGFRKHLWWFEARINS